MEFRRVLCGSQHLVRRCVEAVQSERKVRIAFRLNDMKTDPYLRTKGDRAGEAALSLKSNLVHISLIKVDGQQVYPAVPQAPVSEDASAAEDAGHVSGSDDSTPSELTQSDREQQPQTDEPAMATSF